MKTFLTNSVLRSLTVSVLFSSLALASPSLAAQTFAGRDYLPESPVVIRAFIYPDAQNNAIKMRLENRSASAVRIQIVDENQHPVYNEYVTKPAYYGRFEVSALPYGVYTIELSTRTARHTQQFSLERRSSRRIVMATQPTESDSLIAVNQSLIRR